MSKKDVGNINGQGAGDSVGSPAMDARKPSPSAGERLKELRVGLGLATRDVEEKSQQIAADRHNREYYISHAWVTDIENGKFTPSIYKFHTFSAIYNRKITELL